MLRRIALACLIALLGTGPMEGDTVLPLWVYHVPAGQVQVGSFDRGFAPAFAPGLIVASWGASTVALERATGKLRWSTQDHASAVASNGDDLFFGNGNGGIGARRLTDGILVWHDAAVCPKPAGQAAGTVDRIERFDTNLIVSCMGGLVLRVNATSGTVEGRAPAFDVEHVQTVVPLGSCAYGITGFAGGAHLTERSEILSCRDLHAILPAREETLILGSSGEVAFLNDICCNGRSELAPGIIRVNLLTGTQSAEIALNVDASRYPLRLRNAGQDQNVALIGPNLYFAIGKTLYEFAGAVSLTSRAGGTAVADNLAASPAFLGDDRIGMTITNLFGTVYRIARIDGAKIQPLDNEAMPVTLLYGGEVPVDVDAGLLYTRNDNGPKRYLRVTDGRRFTMAGECSAVLTDQTMLVAQCTLDTIVNRTNVQELRAFAWPK